MSYMQVSEIKVIKKLRQCQTITVMMEQKMRHRSNPIGMTERPESVGLFGIWMD